MFLVAVLLALASALIPALFPTSSASTRLVGSAFDPTTSAVALRGRTQIIINAEMLPDDGLGKPTAVTGLAALMALAPREMWRLPPPGLTAGDGTPRPAAPLETRRVTQAQPRAPPRASI